MAQYLPTHVSSNSLSRSQSSLSSQPTTSAKSRKSSIKSVLSLSVRGRGLFSKVGVGFRTIFRRLSHGHKSLTEMDVQILSTVTNFNREEIEQWHERFITDCPHGYMSRKEFILTYKTLSPNGDAERFARHIFRAFDLDRSKTVDFREFLIGLSMTSTTSSPQTKLEWIFHVFDIDGNGLLTRGECLEVIDLIVRFNQSQVIDDENIDVEQLVTSARRSMMKIFNDSSDRHGNTLTMAQFVEGCQNDAFISELLAPIPESESRSTT